MRRIWAGLAMAIALGGGTAGIVVIAQDGDAEAGTANQFVVAASAGSCTRSSTPITYAEAVSNGWTCGSLDAANDVMQNGDTAIIKGGTYGAQSLTGSNSRTEQVTMTVAEGETMTLDGALQMSGAAYVKVSGGEAWGGVGAQIVMNTMGVDDNALAPDNQFNLGIYDSSHTEFSGIDAGGYQITHSVGGGVMTDNAIRNSDLGPCNNYDAQDPGGSGQAFCSNGQNTNCGNGSGAGCQDAESTGWTVEDNYIHDFNCDDSFFNGQGSDDCHWECMYVSYAKDATVRGNLFVNCANGGNIFHTFSNGSGSFTSDYGFTNYTIENNVFTQSCSNSSAPCGGRLDNASGFGHCNIYSGDDFTNVVIRHNTFLAGSGFDMDNACTSGSPGVTFTGNIRNGGSAACASAWDAGERPTFQYEIYHTFGGSCSGTGNTNPAGWSSLSGKVVSDSNTSPDAHLAGSAWEADELVPTAAGCSATDLDGVTRPVGTNCDAGAYER